MRFNDCMKSEALITPDEEMITAEDRTATADTTSDGTISAVIPADTDHAHSRTTRGALAPVPMTVRKTDGATIGATVAVPTIAAAPANLAMTGAVPTVLRPIIAARKAVRAIGRVSKVRRNAPVLTKARRMQQMNTPDRRATQTRSRKSPR